jgi:hypothetical protein
LIKQQIFNAVIVHSDYKYFRETIDHNLNMSNEILIGKYSILANGKRHKIRGDVTWRAIVFHNRNARNGKIIFLFEDNLPIRTVVARKKRFRSRIVTMVDIKCPDLNPTESCAGLRQKKGPGGATYRKLR